MLWGSRHSYGYPSSGSARSKYEEKQGSSSDLNSLQREYMSSISSDAFSGLRTMCWKFAMFYSCKNWWVSDEGLRRALGKPGGGSQHGESFLAKGQLHKYEQASSVPRPAFQLRPMDLTSTELRRWGVRCSENTTVRSTSLAAVFAAGGLRGGERISYPGCSVRRSKWIWLSSELDCHMSSEKRLAPEDNCSKNRFGGELSLGSCFRFQLSWL